MQAINSTNVVTNAIDYDVERLQKKIILFFFLKFSWIEIGNSYVGVISVFLEKKFFNVNKFVNKKNIKKIV